MEESIKNLLESALNELGQDLEKTTDEVAMYAAERTAVLATVVGLPGYQAALIAERDSVAMFAGLNAVEVAEKSRERILGVIQGALFLGAQMLFNTRPNV